MLILPIILVPSLTSRKLKPVTNIRNQRPPTTVLCNVLLPASQSVKNLLHLGELCLCILIVFGTMQFIVDTGSKVCPKLLHLWIEGTLLNEFDVTVTVVFNFTSDH